MRSEYINKNDLNEIDPFDDENTLLETQIYFGCGNEENRQNCAAKRQQKWKIKNDFNIQIKLHQIFADWMCPDSETIRF